MCFLLTKYLPPCSQDYKHEILGEDSDLDDEDYYYHSSDDDAKEERTIVYALSSSQGVKKGNKGRAGGAVGEEEE